MAERPPPPPDPEPGYRWEPAPSPHRWSLPEAVGRSCRWTIGPGHRACAQPAVAALNRARLAARPTWWGYCGQHLYGAWIEDGQVMRWRLVPQEATADA